MDKIDKYRIALSEVEIDKMLELIDIARIEESLDTTLLSLLSICSQTKAKILTGIKPAYAMSEKQTVEESLGMPKPPPSFDSTVIIPKNVTKEQYWLQCYNKWTNTPDICTLQEIKGAKEHMYINNLMTSAQEAEFELL